MNATSESPSLSSSGFDLTCFAEVEPAPRYAAQRTRAARVGGLSQRRLLNRARVVHHTHRRMEESAEREALFPE